MSWSVIQKNVMGKPVTYRKFICDTIADISTLPIVPAVGAGSECYCSENGATYILETDSDWVIKGSSKGGVSISSLNDTDISNPENGQTLIYNNETDKWENGSSGGGSEPFIVTLLEDEEHEPEETDAFDAVEDSILGYYVADHTYAEIHEAHLAGRTVMYHLPELDWDIECTLFERYGDEADYEYSNSGMGFYRGAQQSVNSMQGWGDGDAYDGYIYYEAYIKKPVTFNGSLDATATLGTAATGTLRVTNGVFNSFINMVYAYDVDCSIIIDNMFIRTPDGQSVRKRCSAFLQSVDKSYNGDPQAEFVATLYKRYNSDLPDTIFIFHTIYSNESNENVQFVLETIPLQSLTPLIVNLTVPQGETDDKIRVANYTYAQIHEAHRLGCDVIYRMEDWGQDIQASMFELFDNQYMNSGMGYYYAANHKITLVQGNGTADAYDGYLLEDLQLIANS